MQVGPTITLRGRADFNGTEQLVFTATDTSGLSDSDTMLVTINAVNDAPVLITDADTTATENVDYTLDVDADDVDGNTLSYSLLTFPTGMALNSSTGVIQWLPINSQVGTHSVSVRVTDGTLADTLAYTLRVTNTPTVPIVSVDDQSFGEDSTRVLSQALLGSWVTDDDTPDSLISWTVSGNSNILVQVGPTITLRGRADFNGTEQLVFTATDTSGLSDSDTMLVTINPVNDAPVIVTDADTTATENVDYTLDVDADDVDGNTLSYTLLTFPTGMAINSSTGVIQWLPINSQVGTHSVSVRVTDGTLADTLAYTLRVTNTPTVPVVSVDDKSFDEDTALVLTTSVLGAFVTDDDTPDNLISWTVSGN